MQVFCLMRNHKLGLQGHWRSQTNSPISNLYPNRADADLPSDTVGIFVTRFFRQLFGLERFRQNNKFKPFVLEQEPTHGDFHILKFTAPSVRYEKMCR